MLLMILECAREITMRPLLSWPRVFLLRIHLSMAL